MGELRKKIAELTNIGVPKFFKQNCMDYYNLYKSPDMDVVTPIPVSKMYNGGIYFIYYKDESNWMSLSPILCADIRDKRIIFGINMNFLPLEIRMDLFDDMVLDLENNNKQSNGMTPFHFLNFESAYKKLLRRGFEYAIVEYDVSRIVRVFNIKYEDLSTWIYSQHPKNIYDPNKLYQIWAAKLKDRPERHKDLISKLVEDFYNVTDELIDNSTALKGHFQRLQRNQTKYGDKFSK
jgi:hypothetical protein